MGEEVRRQPWLRECMIASACTLSPCFIQVSNERLVVPICVQYTLVYTLNPSPSLVRCVSIFAAVLSCGVRLIVAQQLNFSHH